MNISSTKQPYGVLGHLDVPLGLGLLRLSTEGRPDEPAAIHLIHHALDHGVRILDTADSYALNDKDLHYGEALARKAVAAWGGVKGDVRIITKAGMSRPKGRWVPNADPKHLRKMVEGSLKALGVDSIFMLLLHGNDPGTPFESSLAALAALQKEGKVQHLGLCNVDVPEVHQASRHFKVEAIQNELSVMNRAAAAEGTLELARHLGIPFLAHRPLGGHAKVATLEKNRAMKPLADKHGITRAQAALACLLDLGHPVLPLVGATRLESLDASLAMLKVRLDTSDRAALAEKVSFDASPQAARSVKPHAVPAGLRALKAGEGPSDAPEVVIIMGVQGAGKTSLVDRYVAAGFQRLNRDSLGGTLADMVDRLGEHLAKGEQRVVLDNTYPTQVSRFPVVQAALAAGVPVRCIHVATPVHEAMINVVNRVLERHGKLPSAEELKELSKTDNNLPPATALHRWAACFEEPVQEEGFGVVEVVPFQRRHGPATGKALLLDVDGTVRKTLSGELYPTTPEDIEILPGRKEKLQAMVAQGYRLFFVSNQSGVASEKVSLEAVQACFDRTVELLGVPVEGVAFCPHSAFPVGCFCRKPLPGLGVFLAWKHKLTLPEMMMVGDMDSDEEFAQALGIPYAHADAFFGG